MVAPLASFVSPRRWEKRAEGKERMFCHFILEGKPSPLAFTSISLAISSYKGTEIKPVAFTVSVRELGKDGSNEYWKLPIK